jgi:hypothetical protein
MVMSASHSPARMRLSAWFSSCSGQQWGGLAFALGNVLFVVNKLDEMSRLFLSRPMSDLISGQHPGRILVGQVALVIGYVAYYQCYAPRVGRSGRYALRLLSGGGILLAVGHTAFMSSFTDFMFSFVLFGLLFLLIGLIWFGVLTLRKSIMHYWRWLPLFTGLMGFVGFFLFSGEEITAIFLLFRTLFAFGLIGLGIALWRETPMQPDYRS